MRVFYFICFFACLFSCSNIDFVLQKNNEEANKLLHKTIVSIQETPNKIIGEEIVRFFGIPKTNEYEVFINFQEEKKNRIVNTNQVATKIEYQITGDYTLKKYGGHCTLLKEKFITKFFFNPKSSGYNFASDVSLNNLYSLSVKENIGSFIQSVNFDFNSLSCINEN